ncbi:MAG: FAD-binding oxidoreductase [Chloroflexi bacterium]|nr:FAD-binding oxidoreductase [Chloroflexota bacterium]
MNTSHAVDVLVIGAGFTGLCIAREAAMRGSSVIVVGREDLEAASASARNFGQLHSGAVYATFLPSVASECAAARRAWVEYIPEPCYIGAASGLMLFREQANATSYEAAWNELGIEYEEIRLHDAAAITRAADASVVAAFQTKDRAVDTVKLLAQLVTDCEGRGVEMRQSPLASLYLEPGGAPQVRTETSTYSGRVTVLAAGSWTPAVLGDMGIQSPLVQLALPYLEVHQPLVDRVIYNLDGSLVAASPTLGGCRVALPGRTKRPIDNAEIERRLRHAAASFRDDDASTIVADLAWGSVAEPPSPVGADPAAFLVNLTAPPSGWGQADGVFVASCGKWTSALAFGAIAANAAMEAIH